MPVAAVLPLPCFVDASVERRKSKARAACAFLTTILLSVTTTGTSHNRTQTMAISHGNGQINGHSDEPAAAPAPAAEYTIQTFKPLLAKLLQRPSEYTPADLRAALEHLASGHISHAQTGSFLAGLKVTEVWRRPDLVEIIVRFMNHLSGKVKVGAKGHVCDLTWTGESALSVINVALPAGIIAAGAGCRVVKVCSDTASDLTRKGHRRSADHLRVCSTATHLPLGHPHRALATFSPHSPSQPPPSLPSHSPKSHSPGTSRSCTSSHPATRLA